MDLDSRSQRERRRLRKAVVLSFPVAFALHDLEELLTAEAWGRGASERVRRRLPWLPARLADNLAVTTPQMTIAVGVVTAGVAWTTAFAWRRLDDDLGPLPAALTAYTAHGATHLLQSTVLREYTPGVATVPVVIAPYSVWAWRTLREAGLRRDRSRCRRDATTGGVAALGLALTGHAVGRLVTRRGGAPVQSSVSSRASVRHRGAVLHQGMKKPGRC